MAITILPGVNMTNSPAYLAFVQHGWADDNRAMLRLTPQLELPDAPRQVIAPSLNYPQTWLRMSPLINEVEGHAMGAIARHPHTPWRIIGHSMGGLIWLELLTRHPEWWPRVESLVLLASPVGGAHLGRLIDPFSLGIGIAADLGINRRSLAEALAAHIPTLVIAGDLGQGSDGTISVESTKVDRAQFVILPGVSHPHLRHHPATADRIRRYWAGEPVGTVLTTAPLVHQVRQLPGMTDVPPRHYAKAQVLATLKDASTIRVWPSPLGWLHVFVGDVTGACLYSGFVGWQHREATWRQLSALGLLADGEV